MANEFKKAINTQAGSWNRSDMSGDSDIRLEPQIVEEIKLLEPNKTPFITLLDRMGRVEDAYNSEITFMNESPIPDTVIVVNDDAQSGAAVLASDTVLTIDTTDYILPGMVIVNNATREQMFVTNVHGHALAVGCGVAGEIAVTRAFGVSPATAIPLGTELVITALIGEEGQNAFEGVMRGVDSETTYIEELGNSVTQTELSELTRTRGVAEKARLNSQGIRRFKKARELRRLFGEPSKQLTGGLNSKLLYTSGGLRYWCHRHNIIDLNGSLTWDGLAQGMEPILRFASSPDMLGVCSMEMLFELTRLAGFRDSIRRTPSAKSFGFDMQTITIPGGGRLTFLPHQLMSHQYVKNEILVCNMEDFRIYQLRGYMVRKNIQARGSHRNAYELSIYEGLAHVNPLGCGVFRNCRS